MKKIISSLVLVSALAGSASGNAAWDHINYHRLAYGSTAAIVTLAGVDVFANKARVIKTIARVTGKSGRATVEFVKKSPTKAAIIAALVATGGLTVWDLNREASSMKKLGSKTKSLFSSTEEKVEVSTATDSQKDSSAQEAPAQDAPAQDSTT